MSLSKHKWSNRASWFFIGANGFGFILSCGAHDLLWMGLQAGVIAFLYFTLDPEP